MPEYVLMTRLSSELTRDPRGREAVGKEWKKRVDEVCPGVRWIAHYALLGPYDFMDIYEAPDHETAHRVSLISRMGGAIKAESWPAMPYEQFVAMAHAVES